MRIAKRVVTQRNQRFGDGATHVGQRGMVRLAQDVHLRKTGSQFLPDRAIQQRGQIGPPPHLARLQDAGRIGQPQRQRQLQHHIGMPAVKRPHRGRRPPFAAPLAQHLRPGPGNAVGLDPRLPGMDGQADQVGIGRLGRAVRIGQPRQPCHCMGRGRDPVARRGQPRQRKSGAEFRGKAAGIARVHLVAAARVGVDGVAISHCRLGLLKVPAGGGLHIRQAGRPADRPQTVRDPQGECPAERLGQQRKPPGHAAGLSRQPEPRPKAPVKRRPPRHRDHQPAAPGRDAQHHLMQDRPVKPRARQDALAQRGIQKGVQRRNILRIVAQGRPPAGSFFRLTITYYNSQVYRNP